MYVYASALAHVNTLFLQGLDPAGLNLLIQSGAPVNYQDMWKRTPLHYAAREGQVEACQRLVELGADLRLGNHLMSISMSISMSIVASPGGCESFQA